MALECDLKELRKKEDLHKIEEEHCRRVMESLNTQQPGRPEEGGHDGGQQATRSQLSNLGLGRIFKILIFHNLRVE